MGIGRKARRLRKKARLGAPVGQLVRPPAGRLQRLRGVTAAHWLTVALVVLGVPIPGCDGTYEPVAADDSGVPESLRWAYTTDAARLALRNLRERNDPALGEIELPREEVERFYAALIRVYDLRHPARDAVVETYAIHTSPRPSVHYLSLVLTPTGWPEAWQRGERLTGKPAVDSLVLSYDLQVETYYHGASFGDVVTVFSPSAINIQALAGRFALIEGVRQASGRQLIGDGDDIVADETDSGLRLEYSVGYGDCLSGCIHRRYWAFRVEPDGRVRYLGSWGDPPP